MGAMCGSVIECGMGVFDFIVSNIISTSCWLLTGGGGGGILGNCDQFSSGIGQIINNVIKLFRAGQ